MSNEEEIITTSISDTLPRLGRTSPILSYFCIYNPTFSSSEENTKDQILYFTAKKSMPLDMKMKQVGLAQALVNFTNTFSPSRPAQNVHSQKNRMVFLEPEPNFWMVMCVELGIMRKQSKDGKLITEYLDAQLNDRALESVLTLGYEQFKLLNGSFHYFLKNNQTGRQQVRGLVMAIEEFFSDWIWKWDFDRLDKMCFNAVFNGISHQPLVDSNRQMIRALYEEVMKKAKLHDGDDTSHLFVFHAERQDSLIYHSPSLSIANVCSVKKYTARIVEKHEKHEAMKRDLEREALKLQDPKVSALKSFTKSLSTSNLINYFSNKPSEAHPSTSPRSTHARINATSDSSPVDDSIEDQDTITNNDGDTITNTDTNDNDNDNDNDSDNDSDNDNKDNNVDGDDNNIKEQGVYLTGLIDSVAINMNGEEQHIKKTDIVKVYLTEEDEQNVIPYYLLIYKHKTGLLFNYLLPCTSTIEKRVSNIKFYDDLERWMMDSELVTLSQNIINDISSDKKEVKEEETREENMLDSRYYKYFSFNSKTLEISTTFMDEQPNGGDKNKKKKKRKEKEGTDIKVNNEVLLQMLDLKDDFDRKGNNEVYTRSTSNYWITGQRLYFSKEHYKETFLIATRKDTSLANIQGTLIKLNAL